MIFLYLHLCLLCAAVILALVAKEDNYKPLIALAFIPILGPILAVIGYIVALCSNKK